MEKVIVIMEREEVEGNKGTYLKLTDQEDKTHNIFGDLKAKWGLCAQGQSVVLVKEKSTDGKWWNVVDVKPVSEAIGKLEKQEAKTVEVPAGATPKGYQPRDNSASIEAQVAIKEIGECWRAGKLKDDDILVAGCYRPWLLGRLSPPQMPPSTPEKQQPGASKPETVVLSPPTKTVKPLPKQLEADLHKLAEHDESYHDENLVPYLENIAHKKADSLPEAIGNLNKVQTAEFFGRVKEAVKKLEIEFP